MTEVRSQLEGELRWVEGSGSGLTWATASAAPTALMAYVTNFQYTSARDIQQIMDRGEVVHHKLVAKQGIQVQFDVQWGITANYPSITSSGGGSTVPHIHMELKCTAPEAGASMYMQFHGVALNSFQMSEGTPANALSVQGVALAMNGPTASGYIAA